MNGCTCTGPGWCERHQVTKNAHWVHLCQTRMDYFMAWEHGNGPGQRRSKSASQNPVVPKKKSSGWGDQVTVWLKRIGITEASYAMVKEKFGLPPTCGCAKRREWLNKVGRWWLGKEA